MFNAAAFFAGAGASDGGVEIVGGKDGGYTGAGKGGDTGELIGDGDGGVVFDGVGAGDRTDTGVGAGELESVAGDGAGATAGDLAITDPKNNAASITTIILE